jgi:spermidine synthase
MYEVGPGGGGSTGVIVYSTVHTKLHVLHGGGGEGGSTDKCVTNH